MEDINSSIQDLEVDSDVTANNNCRVRSRIGRAPAQRRSE